MTFGKCTKCEDLEDTIGELRRSVETHETRITELESQLSLEEEKRSYAEFKLEDAMERIELWRATVSDLVKRHFRDAEDYDKQLRDVCDLLQEPFPGEEKETPP